MRYALLGTTVLVGFALATYACGGDDATTIPDTDAGTHPGSSTSSTSSSGNSTSSSSGSTTSSSTSSSGNTSGDGGNTSSGNPVTPADAGEVGDASDIPDSGGAIPDSSTAFDGAAGSKCQVGSQQESEDNGTAGSANTIPSKTGTFCGSLSTPADKDFVKFTLPADATNLEISTSNTGADFVLNGTVDGTPFAISGPDAGAAFPFKAGSVYTLEASTTAASGATDYIIGVTITEQPAASKCAATSVVEVEPNDTDGTATPVPASTGSWCGNITTATDVDKFKFVMPSGKSSIAFNFSTTNATGFTLAATHNGTPITDFNNFPINAGETYVFTASSTTANNGYIINLTLP